MQPSDCIHHHASYLETIITQSTVVDRYRPASNIAQVVDLLVLSLCHVNDKAILTQHVVSLWDCCS